ncbi:glycosyltransferase [Psychromonas sp.]|nr:glycosyltransferase [Psychromonas sp.]
MRNKVAVAMSVYKADSPIYLKEALESIYNQLNVSVFVFLQVDGNIPKSLKSVIEFYDQRSDFLLEYYPDNKGLAFQLNRAIARIGQSGGFKFIARMDADDISLPSRFERQICFFDGNPEIAVVGTSVIEFFDDGRRFSKVMMPNHSDLVSHLIRRCPFNHPTVMFNMDVILLKDVNYDESLMNTQDYYLWVDLVCKKYIFSNINEPLLEFRVDSDFHSRRGMKKAINDFKSRFYAMRKLKAFTVSNVIHSFLLFFLRLSPPYIKEYAYKNFR